ncbi:hypothetical protein ES705_06378 [subsurface metagenome]
MGTLTGMYANQPDGRWYEFFLAKPGDSDIKGYAREDVIKILSENESKQKSKKGQDLIDKLVKSDVEVFHILARSAALLNTYIDKGLVVSKFQNRYSELLTRLSERQHKLKTSKILKTKTGFKKGLKNTLNAFRVYMRTFYGIGGAPIVAVAVVGAVVGVGLSITAYFLFRSDYSESTEDLNISKELELALMNLDPETAEKIIIDLEGQVDKAYAKGKTAGKFTGAFGFLKMAAVFVLGFMTIDYISKKRKGSSGSIGHGYRCK